MTRKKSVDSDANHLQPPSTTSNAGAINQEFCHYEIDAQGIAWLTLDRQHKSVNTLDQHALLNLETELSAIQNDKTIQALVIKSAKDNNFIAGADIDYFSQLNGEQALEFVRLGQRVMEKITALKIPTIAMINGHCLGGGFELALACDYRIACVSEKTVLGLPEIQLGIFPAWGGVRRLIQLMGLVSGLLFVLKSRVVDAITAKRMKLIDEAVPLRQFDAAVMHYIQQHPHPRRISLWTRCTLIMPIRRLIISFMHKRLHKQINPDHYPAPFGVLNLCERLSPQSTSFFSAEVSLIDYLINQHTTARELVYVFKLRDELKKQTTNLRKPVKHVHVIGAGTMGGAIAAWCALRGFTVTVHDQTPERISGAFKQANELFKFKVKDPYQKELAWNRLIADPEGGGCKTADVIIEAIIEDLNAKQDLFKSLELLAPAEAILVTNTSSIPLEKIAEAMKQPERLVGIHFFNPVSRMPLVEIIYGEQTAEHFIHAAHAFTHQLDRLPLKVKSSPGFLVNRLLMPYLLESMNLLNEGLPAEWIDRIATQFGMPMGPIELADRVGLDVCLAVAKYLLNESSAEVPVTLIQRVEQGKLGVKTGAGFYTYQKGKAVKQYNELPTSGQEEATNRLIMPILKQAIRILSEDIVKDYKSIDAGLIFGIGFAPFRGGLSHYVTSLGMVQLQKIISQLVEMHGDRFAIDVNLAWKYFHVAVES